MHIEDCSCLYKLTDCAKCDDRKVEMALAEMGSRARLAQTYLPLATSFFPDAPSRNCGLSATKWEATIKQPN